MNDGIFLSVVIPAYNEEPNIGKTLSEVVSFLAGKDFLSEVIVIDDGSTDSTVSLARCREKDIKGLKVIESSPNMGKGYVVRKAMEGARGRYVMFMDADNSTSIYELNSFLPYLEKGYDIAIGSRRIKGSRILTPEPALRVFMGDVYIFLSKVILGVDASDFNCGFKVYTAGAARKIFLLQKMTDWSFDTELLFIAKKLGLSVKEVPVRWAHHDDTSKVRPLKAGIDSFLSLLKIKVNSVRGVYGRSKPIREAQ